MRRHPLLTSTLLVRETGLALALLLLLSAQQVLAQAPHRFPGLVYRLVDINESSQELTTEENGELTTTADQEEALSLLIEEYQLINERAGPYDPERMQALTDIGFAYQDLGAHSEAITAFEEALQLYRIQDGLNSLQQISIVDAIAESEAALQNIERADNMESLALHVISRTYPEGSDVLTRRQIKKANWDIRYFLLSQLYLHQSDHYRLTSNSIINDNTGEDSVFNILPGEEFYFGYLGGQPTTLAITSDSFSDHSYRLTQAEELLNKALADERLTTEEKITTLRQLAAIEWYREVELYNLYHGYQHLKDSSKYLDSRIAYSLENEFYREGASYLEDVLDTVKSLPDSTPEDIATAMIDLADWDIAFYRHRDAETKYAEVQEYLQEHEFSTEDIQQFMNPVRLLNIPVFATHQYELPWWQGEIEGSGLVEVNATLRKTGKIRRINMGELTDPDESEYIRSMLRSYLQDGIFRPLIENGEPVEQENLQLLFEYSY